MSSDQTRTIQAELEPIARDESVRILYACESGSRAWGFASPDSDFDVRFLYVRPVEEYLRLERPRDVIERPIVDDLDLSGWDLFKTCQLLRKSNRALLEWLGSPVVYRDDGIFAAELRAQAQRWFSVRACCETYLHQARNVFSKDVCDRADVIRKRYLYVVRPLACAQWLATHGTFPPTPFREVLGGVELPTAIADDVDGLIREKAAGRELGQTPAIPSLNDYILECLVQLEAAAANLPSRPFPSDELDQLIQEVLLGSAGRGPDS